MKEVIISVEIFCHWSITPPAYRIYVDDDLLTERSYIWNNNEQFVKENIIVNLEPGIHTFKVQPVDKDFVGFGFRNFTIDKQFAFIKQNQFTVH